MFKSMKRSMAVSRLVEEQLYERVAMELSQGYRREGLWAKALADAGGSEKKAKARYIKYRVLSLSDEAEIKSALAEEKRAVYLIDEKPAPPKRTPRAKSPPTSRTKPIRRYSPIDPSPEPDEIIQERRELSDSEREARLEDCKVRLKKMGIKLECTDTGWTVTDASGTQERHKSLASLAFYVELLD